jgi:hypothetical protein
VSASNRTWIVLAALVVVVAVAYYLLEVQGIADQTGGVETVWELESDQIVAIRLSDHFLDQTVVLERGADGEWWIEGEPPLPAQPSICDLLSYTLANMQVQRSIEEPPEAEMSAYGLTDPGYTIVLRREDGRLMSLEVGARQESGVYYARRAGDQAVLLVPAYAVEEAIGYIQSPPVDQPPAATPGVPLIGPETPSEP